MIFSELLSRKPTVILDGAMGTELQRHGVDIGLPLWSANALIHAPHVVRNVHFFHLHAGADILTTNTFRTNMRVLKRAGFSSRWEELNLKAVEFAYEARDRYRPARAVVIAGCLAPLEDCYSPDLVPSDQELEDEHGAQAELLALNGVEMFLVETMLDLREAVIAARACLATGKECAVSFVTTQDGMLLSGETLTDAVKAVQALGVSAILVNCVNAKHMHVALALLLETAACPAGCYANVGTPVKEGTHVQKEVSMEEYVEAAARWQEMGARIIGGCCGTTPEMLAAVVERIAPLSEEFRV